MMMPLCGAGAACAVVGFPKTKLVDDSPLVGAGIFGGTAVGALKMAPKNPAMYMVSAGAAVATVASLSVLGLSSEDAKQIASSTELVDAAAHIETRKAAVIGSL